MRARPGRPYMAGAPLLIAHRGGSALAPENTLAAFDRAVRDWAADMLEMDVRATRDGHVVVIHDATVDRTTDGTGAVADLSWAELRELDAGHRFSNPSGEHSFRGKGVGVPLFEDVLTRFPGIRLNVESKSADAAAGLVAVVRKHAAERRVLVAAEHEPARRDARGYGGPWGASARQLRRLAVALRVPGGSLYVPRADALQVPDVWRGKPVVTPGFLERAHARNLPVHVWTVDDPDRMRELVAWGIDGIQTDRPDLLAAVLEEMKGRPPAPGART